MFHVRRLLPLAVVIGLIPAAAFAQAARETKALVTVLDPSGGVLPGATVTVIAVDEAAKTGTDPTSTTNDKGLATINGLKPGRHQIRATFQGFEDGLLADVRLRAGDNKHVVVLQLSKFEQQLTVSRDATNAASDPHGGSLTSTLTQAEINALSDDPNELAQQLIDMAGGNAVIRIDSFVGGQLPPKAFIKSIRIARDTFPAENHSAENDEIEIITAAGVGALRGSFSTRLRDGSMNGRNPFVDLKAPERNTGFDSNVGGTIVPEKSSFSLFLRRNEQWDTPVATFTTATGKQSLLLGRRPNNGWSGQAMMDYALTKNQTLRASYSRNTSTRGNLGVGGFDLAERAYSSESGSHQIRLQEAGPLGRRGYITTRLQLRASDSTSHSLLEAPTVRVLDGVTSGGAQVAGGRRQRDFEFGSDWNYVRGIHTVRVGTEVTGRHLRTDDAANYLGTYVFSSTADFVAGRPRNYTRRIGNPLITYSSAEGGVYVQDDLRIRRNLTFSPGLRWEAETHVHDLSGFAPRLGLTWAPGAAGKTTVRASWGVFYNWLGGNIYEQTLRIDGLRQQELNIVNPTFPDPGSVGTVTATNKYLLNADLGMERYYRTSLAIDRTLSPKLRTSVTFAVGRYGNQVRGLNLNSPRNGVRPDPLFANVVEVVSDASTHMYDVIPDFSVNFAGGDRQAANARWSLKRTNIRFNYRYRHAENNSDGPFNPPPSGSLADQWGPAGSDQRHRYRASISTQALRRLNVNMNWDANSGGPYTITTGFDDNGDSIFNDRPIGTPRGTARLPWRSTISSNVSYTIPLGPQGADGGGGGGGGDRGGERGGPRGGGRSRGITLNMSIQNLTNRDNYVGFSGVMTSAYFRQATSVANPRQIDFSVRFGF